MVEGQRRHWNREYRLRGRLWRGEIKETEIFQSTMIPGLSLDNGCGNGKGAPVTDDMIGLDYSHFALKLYPGKFRILGNMLNLPFKNSSFSNVVFIHSLDHLLTAEREGAIREASRVLIDKGRIIIRVFSEKDFRFGKGREIERGTFIRGDSIITHYFNLKEFLKYDFLESTAVHEINYYINIKNERIKRAEFIIILVKCNSENIHEK